jgi:hypothetical protein
MRLTLAQLWAFLAVSLPATAALAAPMSTVDLAYQVRAGQLMLDAGQVLRADPFTFTVGGQPWLDQQWLAQVGLAALYELGGWGLLAVVHGVLAGLAYGLLQAALRRRGLDVRPAAWVTLGVFVVSAASIALRPQLLGIVLLALVLYLLARGGRVVWAIPAIVAVWANVHGSFALGPVVVGLVWLEQVGRSRTERPSAMVRLELLGVAVLSLAATLVNPFGIDVWRYALGLATSSEIASLVTEWQRTIPTTYAGAMFYASLVVALFVAWRVRGRLSAAAVLGLLGFAIAGAYAERGTVWWAFVAPWLLAPAIARPTVAAHARSQRTGRLNLAVAGLVGLLGLAVLPWPYRSTSGGALPLLADAPGSLSRALAEALPSSGRVLVAQPWASWFELEVPAAETFVDSRIELFPTGVWDDYLTIAEGADDTLGLLDRWSVDAVVLDAGQVALADRLAASPAWKRVVTTVEGVLFVHAGP